MGAQRYHAKKEALLDETVMELKTMDRTGNEARYSALWGQMFTLMFELYDDGTERFVNLLEDLFRKFDAEKGEKFSHYFKYVLSRRKNDQYQDIADRKLQLDSLDQTVFDGADATLGEMIPAPLSEDPSHRLEALTPLLELTSMILNFSACHHNKADNETKRNWYRIFYTEDVTLGAKTAQSRFLHERDVFTALKKPYLDYYMEKICRSMREIGETKLKPYCEVVPEQTDCMQEVPVPIPADVSLSYLKNCEGYQASKAARSNQRGDYKREKEQLKQC